jgi:hypothetical protein
MQAVPANLRADGRIGQVGRPRHAGAGCKFSGPPAARGDWFVWSDGCEKNGGALHLIGAPLRGCAAPVGKIGKYSLGGVSRCTRVVATNTAARDQQCDRVRRTAFADRRQAGQHLGTKCCRHAHWRRGQPTASARRRLLAFPPREGGRCGNTGRCKPATAAIG